MIRAVQPQGIGISAIATHEPPWVLGNDWFADVLPRKFVQHTGIQSRHVSTEDEVTMGVRAVENLRSQAGCDLRDCVAVVFASPSFIHSTVARKFLDERRVQDERTQRAAEDFSRRIGVVSNHVYGINWGCSGYGKALSIVRRHVVPWVGLQPDQFILVATVSRISRITDYASKQTGALFGDLAAVTLLARTDSAKYPVHFSLIYSGATMQPADGVYFDYHLQDNALLPTPDGGKSYAPRRLVFSLDGLGIGDAAPRAMAAATAKALRAARIAPADVQFVVPHQAGTGIVRLTAMKLEEIGLRGQVINGMTSEVGNISACSVPYALAKAWRQLRGTIVCPMAGVGKPGDAKVSQGCAVLRATELHQRSA
jgi:3-oxoacyl-[acyl-carrier-protein] synthase-3